MNERQPQLFNSLPLFYCSKIPKSDVFEVVDIPDMCLYQNKCLTAKSTGCFLSLIKRKQITRLDEKHLITMAEKRGLFGDSIPKVIRSKSKIVKKDEQQKQIVTVTPKKVEEIAQKVNILCYFISLLY